MELWKTLPNEFATYKKTLKQFEEPKMSNLKFLSIKHLELGSFLWVYLQEVGLKTGFIAGKFSAAVVGKLAHSVALFLLVSKSLTSRKC